MENKHLRALILTAVFAAMSIVLGKFLAFNIGDTIRISFENLPIMLASFLLGPIWGGACGLIADTLGCVLKGYALIPLITVASVLMGVIPGTLTRYIFKKNNIPAVMISGFISHVVCSMAVKTVALHYVYGTPFAALLATRIPIYIVTGGLEAYICAVLLRSKVIKREILIDCKCRKEKDIQTPKSVYVF